MSVTKEYFGTMADGTEVYSYTLDNGYVNARVIDYGATLVNLCVPDKDGIRDDIVLGYDYLKQYEENGGCLGATVGPVCNRTANAEMPIDGVVYHMVKNNGENNLHTDKKDALFKRHWDAICGEEFVTFTISMADGELGLPGERHFTATYSLTVDNGLKLHYHATSDKRTAINLTNHTYFNLDGHEGGVVNDQLLTINASTMTATDEGSVPTGELRDLTGTPLDFRVEKPIGRDIDEDYDQLNWAGGYDHNYCVDGYTGNGDLVKAATARSLKTGRIMEVYTSLPGVQLYTANGLDVHKCKNGHDYGRRHAFCLETQFYPDTIHHENFPSYLFGKGESYDAVTKFCFKTDNDR